MLVFNMGVKSDMALIDRIGHIQDDLRKKYALGVQERIEQTAENVRNAVVERIEKDVANNRGIKTNGLFGRIKVYSSEVPAIRVQDDFNGYTPHIQNAYIDKEIIVHSYKECEELANSIMSKLESEGMKCYTTNQYGNCVIRYSIKWK